MDATITRGLTTEDSAIDISSFLDDTLPNFMQCKNLLNFIKKDEKMLSLWDTDLAVIVGHLASSHLLIFDIVEEFRIWCAGRHVMVYTVKPYTIDTGGDQD